MKNKPTQQQQT